MPAVATSAVEAISSFFILFSLVEINEGALDPGNSRSIGGKIDQNAPWVKKFGNSFPTVPIFGAFMPQWQKLAYVTS
ncbi:hypothetical protein [Paramylibacter kogurei]|uniref:hypothetical protein n=1 Tax=Paramylibacter kogurei TaxID=1889778 RepID=UPI0013FE05B9|nr:hypothetical protein [Amylibacter kogurei]